MNECTVGAHALPRPRRAWPCLASPRRAAPGPVTKTNLRPKCWQHSHVLPDTPAGERHVHVPRPCFACVCVRVCAWLQVTEILIGRRLLLCAAAGTSTLAPTAIATSYRRGIGHVQPDRPPHFWRNLIAIKGVNR